MTKVTKVRVESEGGDETTNRRLSLVMVLRCQPPPKENKEDEEMLLISDNLIFGHMGYSDPLQKVTQTNPFKTTRGPEYSRYWSIKWYGKGGDLILTESLAALPSMPPLLISLVIQIPAVTAMVQRGPSKRRRTDD